MMNIGSNYYVESISKSLALWYSCYPIVHPVQVARASQGRTYLNLMCDNNVLEGIWMLLLSGSDLNLFTSWANSCLPHISR